ncbi:MAG: hypothetical protein ABIU95_01150 [Burkholderiales bacterium]
MIRVTLALGLRSTAQSLGVIGRDLGVFAAHGVDLAIIREETAGPEGLRGLIDGDYEFAEFGAVPIVQGAFEGKDPLILMAAEPVSALYILGRTGVSAPSNVTCVGVLSAAGQTGFSARKMLERWGRGDAAQLVPLGTYPKIYRALAAGEIDAGVLTADYRLAGELAHGFHALVDLGAEFRFQGPVVATTRRLRDRDPERVRAVVAAYVDAIARFKSSPAEVVPILKRHLGFVDDAQAEAIQRFYAARFQARPLASVEGVARVIATMAGDYPGVTLRAEDLCDASFVQSATAGVH